MDSRYVGKVVSVIDSYMIVVNIGLEHGVRPGEAFTVVGLGDIIIDPDTKETLGQLEMVRGRVVATHVQERISTLTSSTVQRDPDVKETNRKSPARFMGFSSISPFANDAESVKETIRIGTERVKPLENPKVGDLLLRA